MNSASLTVNRKRSVPGGRARASGSTGGGRRGGRDGRRIAARAIEQSNNTRDGWGVKCPSLGVARKIGTLLGPLWPPCKLRAGMVGK